MSSTATSLVPSSSAALERPRPTVATSLPTELASIAGFVGHKVPSALTPLARPASTATAAAPSSTPSPSPGRFRHPRTTEILARNSATSLSEAKIRAALTNVAALLLSFIFRDVYYGCATFVLHTAGFADTSPIPSALLALVRLVLLVNITLLLRPVIPALSKTDDISDIPLTPSQRSLLGLSPSVGHTPNSAESAAPYITPPRYRRSGSFSSSPSHSPHALGGSAASERRSISATYSSSPLSTSRVAAGLSSTPSKVVRRTASGSPFSPSPTASPLFHQAVNQSSQMSDGDFGASVARPSIRPGAGFGLSRSQSLRDNARRGSLDPSSPPPPKSMSPQLVPGLNYKWLYDKGRRLPTSDSYGF